MNTSSPMRLSPSRAADAWARHRFYPSELSETGAVAFDWLSFHNVIRMRRGKVNDDHRRIIRAIGDVRIAAALCKGVTSAWS